MAVGFAAMAYVGSSPLLLILCMIFLTVGEVFAFSNWSIVIDSYAKPGLKGSYFGASGFGLLGNSVGPLMGGYLYQSSGAIFTFNLLGFLSALGVLFYIKAENRRTPQQEEALSH
jgi:MFS family permease